MSDFDDINLRNLLEHAHVGVAIHDANTRIVYANPAALTLLRLTYDQLIGKDTLDPQWNFIDESNRRLHPDEYPVTKVLRLQAALRNEVLGVIDGRSPNATWFSVNAYPECGPDGRVSFVVVIFAEISSDRAQFSFKDVVENADDMVIVTEAGDLDAPSGPRIVYVNPAVEAATGYTAAELVGETPRLLQGSLTDAAARSRIREHLEQRKPVREKLLNYTKDGAPYWVEMNIVPLFSRTGVLTHFAAIERNISGQVFQADQLKRRNDDLRLLRDNLQEMVRQRTSELRDANAKLERLAFYDGLTQIPNRRSFLDHAAAQLARASRHHQVAVVGILDLDHFKAVNDTHGHAMGDRVLVTTAGCLTRFFRQEDVVGRLGGEEFAFCMVLGSGVDPLSIGERLRTAVSALQVQTDDGLPVPISASLGLALVDAQAGQSAEGDAMEQGEFESALTSTLERADAALYEAKRAGRNCVRLAPASESPTLPAASP